MRPNTVVYRGERLLGPNGKLDTASEVLVTRDKVELTPALSLNLRNHSPTGFSWGYPGSGPAQLALAILLDFTGSPEQAQYAYQWFKTEFVASWGHTWSINGAEIRAWLATHKVA